MKFNEWGVKRPRRAKADASSFSDEGITSIGIIPPDSAEHDGGSLPTSKPTTSARVVHHRSHITHACSCCSVDLEDRARELSKCAERDLDPLPYWEAEPHKISLPSWTADNLARGGNDNIVHSLVRGLKWIHMGHVRENYEAVLKRILEHMKDWGLDVDSRDCNGMTALEVSILTNNKRAMTTLLDHGASLELCDSDNEERDSELGVRLVAELLRRARKTELSCESIINQCAWSVSLSEISTALTYSEGIESHCENFYEGKSALEETYYVLEQVIFHSNRLEEGEEAYDILRTLLENWNHRGMSHHTIEGRVWAVDCVAKLLSLFDFDDGVIFYDETWQREHGEDCRCYSATAFIFFHVCDKAIVDLVLAHSKSHDLPGLAAFIIDPCPMRNHRCDGAYLSRLWSQLVPSLDDAGADFLQKVSAWMSYWVEEYGTPDALIPTIWETVIHSFPAGVHLGMYGFWKLARPLLQLSESQRWSLMELWLPREPGFPGSLQDRSTATLFSPNPETSYLHYASFAYLDHLCHWMTGWCPTKDSMPVDPHDHDWNVSNCCGSHTYIEPDHENPEGWQVDARLAIKMQQCVIHVVTKDLCNRESLFAPEVSLKERIQSALRLRKQFKLPAFAIKQSLLLRVLNGATGNEEGDAVEDEDEETDGDGGGAEYDGRGNVEVFEDNEVAEIVARSS